jgi:hypothetical protein
MFLLKQSTAATVKIGPFLDSTDGVTAETGLTISQADVRLSKNGGNIAQKNESSACTHDELGIYDCDLDATDTNTVGRLRLDVQESGALPVWHEYMILPSNTWDSLVGGSDYLQSDIIQIEGSDATDQIRDAVVDDSTRIDASALNTLSGNDPGGQLAAQSDITGLNDISVSDVLTTQMTEAYAADGVAPTLAQAVFAIMQNICEIQKSGTTLTIKKLDGSTTAMTFTLDDADDPSSRTRSS